MHTSPPSIAIILPAYNEELTIGATLQAFHAVLPEALLCVINNNSADRTAEIAAHTLEDGGMRGIVLHEARQGKANAVRRAFFEVDADIYVMVDADCTYPAEVLPMLIAPVAAGEVDMVCGDRLSDGDYFQENRRSFHSFGNLLVQRLVNGIFSTQFRDVMTGYRVMSRLFVAAYPIVVEGFQLETDMTLFAAQTRMRVREIPIRYKDRPAGSASKLHTYKDGMRVLLTIFNIFRMCCPMLFFMLAALLLAILSLATGGVVVQEWLETRYISHVPLAVLATALGLLSGIAVGTGCVLDAVQRRYRAELESRLRALSTPRFFAGPAPFRHSPAGATRSTDALQK